MSRLKIIIYLLFCAICTFAQTSKENIKKAQQLQTDENYICGLGHGSTLKQASANALAALSGQISTSVASDFSYLITSEDKNGELVETSKVDNIIKTYTHTTLRNALELIIEDEPDATVLRYIKRADLDMIFEQRRNKVLEYASNAQKYEKENKVADALSSYYAALSLLRSLPDGDNMKIKIGFKEETLLMPLISRNVNDILSGITIRTESIEDDGDERTIVIDVRYKGNPATNFNYTYFNGCQRSDVCTAKDGIGDITIPKDFSITKIDIQAEYMCEDEANYDKELRDVISNTDPVPFRTARMKIAKGDGVKPTNANTTTAAASIASADNHPNTSIVTNTMEASTVSPYLATMQKIEIAIRQKNYSSVKECFTDAGYEMFTKLINYGKAKLLRAPILQFQENGDEVVCRSFPMSFTFSGNRRTFVEDVVFHLTKDGRVCEMAFGLNKPAVNDIMQRGAWSDEARTVMVNFLESYKTAYALKRLDYINSIFSNDALIITGSFVKSTGNKEIGPSNVKHVKYTRQTKAQYMKSLKACFASNEYVNIHFADNIIRRSASNPNIYGIQIKQDYYSSSYGDTGYLFLLIDFTDVKAPLIHVRTWQPDKDPNARDGRIGMQDFQL